MNWTAVAFAAVSGFITIGIAIIAAKTRSRQKTWARAEATVTGTKEMTDNDGGKSTRVFYRFTDAHGSPRTGFVERLVRPEKKVATLAVMYDPANPDLNEDVAGKWVYLSLVIAAVVFAGALAALIITWS